ncbi:MAG TPA: class I SAM-dependent methyltransferase [Solirubrobacteraceae bacterium]|nr:class I SAM-dependent methyltransferase [Solirubrobacteraceae bacterium]
MPNGTLERSYGKVFDEVADEYDRHRPTYPDALLDHACEVGALGAGDHVLEIGCGTGQLTRGLLARGLRVMAIEPGDRLIALAQQNLGDTGDVQFVNVRLEDVPLPREHFRAVFSASAMHWIDPDFGWQKAADALAPGGTLALIQYFGLNDPRSADDQRELLSAIAKVAPEFAVSWPTYREIEAILAGVHERRGNVSEVWAWLGDYDMARDYAAGRFEDAQIAAVPRLVEHTAEELSALLGTMSFWSRLSPHQRAAIEDENRALYEHLGRSIRSSILACAVTAHRAA